MILKLQTGVGQWTFYDGLEKVTYKVFPYSEVRNIEVTVITGETPLDGDCMVLWVSTLERKHESYDERTFIVCDKAYLLNDDGKTIERIF